MANNESKLESKFLQISPNDPKRPIYECYRIFHPFLPIVRDVPKYSNKLVKNIIIVRFSWTRKGRYSNEYWTIHNWTTKRHDHGLVTKSFTKATSKRNRCCCPRNYKTENEGLIIPPTLKDNDDFYIFRSVPIIRKVNRLSTWDAAESLLTFIGQFYQSARWCGRFYHIVRRLQLT